MKILFINRVYPPSTGATGQLLAELASELVKAGWEVAVVTSRASRDSLSSEIMAGVRVERVGSLPFTRASHGRRALSYLTLYPALLWRALLLPRADVVVTLTDPPLHLLFGVILKWTKRSRLVHWAQDLYPELAEQLGVLPAGGLLAKCCRRLSNWGLKRHDRVIAIGRCMKQRLLERGLSEVAIHVVPNWSNAAQIIPIEHLANPFRRKYGLENRFVVMYSGNLGLAHPFEAMIDAAKILLPAQPEIMFLFVGDGPRLPWVQEQTKKYRLENVRFLPSQPAAQLALSLSAADVHLASMHENLWGLVVPSKVYGIFAAGRPCVFLGPSQSEVAHRITQNECGSVLESPTGAELAACLLEWKENRELWKAASHRAKHAADGSDSSQAVEAFAAILSEVCHQHSAGREIGLPPGRPQHVRN